VISYSIVSRIISNSLSENYGIKLNNERIELGLKPITKNWTLDSIVLQYPLSFSCDPKDSRGKTEYWLLENKWYCQYWTNREFDKTKPYHKSKEIYFTKSFWFWQNEVDFEYDKFINPNSNLAEYEELKMTTLWQNTGEVYGQLKHMKNGEDLLIDFDVNQSMFGFEKEKVNEILEKWELK
jgi:hypothetical protein